MYLMYLGILSYEIIKGNKYYTFFIFEIHNKKIKDKNSRKRQLKLKINCAYQPTSGLTSICPQTKVREHLV